MKIYIMTDMEGISGIDRIEQVKQTHPEHYKPACDLLVQDINVAVDAAFEAGATEVLVADGHGGGKNFTPDQLDPRAIFEDRQNGPHMDESFSGMLLIGYHARAGTLNAFLDHTMSSEAWFEYRINDEVVGEIAIEAAVAAHYDVPVLAVTGDAAAVAEAKALLGEVECAVVKSATRRNQATCLPLPEAHQRIREAVIAAVRSPERFKPWKPSLPATIQLTHYRTDMTEVVADKPGVERVDARTVRKIVTALKDICTW